MRIGVKGSVQLRTAVEFRQEPGALGQPRKIIKFMKNGIYDLNVLNYVKDSYLNMTE